MTTDCSLSYKFNTRKFQVQTWEEHVVYRNCFWIQNNFCTQHVLPIFCKKKSFWQRFTCTYLFSCTKKYLKICHPIMVQRMFLKSTLFGTMLYWKRLERRISIGEIRSLWNLIRVLKRISCRLLFWQLTFLKPVQNSKFRIQFQKGGKESLWNTVKFRIWYCSR